MGLTPFWLLIIRMYGRGVVGRAPYGWILRQAQDDGIKTKIIKCMDIKKRGVQRTLYAAVLVTDRLRPEQDLHNNRADNYPSNYPQDRMTTAFFRRPFLRSFVSSCSLLAIFGGSSTAITRLVAATTRSGLLRIFSFHCFPPCVIIM